MTSGSIKAAHNTALPGNMWSVSVDIYCIYQYKNGPSFDLCFLKKGSGIQTSGSCGRLSRWRRIVLSNHWWGDRYFVFLNYYGHGDYLAGGGPSSGFHFDYRYFDSGSGILSPPAPAAPAPPAPPAPPRLAVAMSSTKQQFESSHSPQNLSHNSLQKSLPGTWYKQ